MGIHVHAPSLILGTLTPFIVTYAVKWTLRVFVPSLGTSLVLVPETIKDVCKALAAAIQSGAVATVKTVAA